MGKIGDQIQDPTYWRHLWEPKSGHEVITLFLEWFVPIIELLLRKTMRLGRRVQCIRKEVGEDES